MGEGVSKEYPELFRVSRNKVVGRKSGPTELVQVRLPVPMVNYLYRISSGKKAEYIRSLIQKDMEANGVVDDEAENNQ